MVYNVNKEVNDYSSNYTVTKSILLTLPSKWLLLYRCYTYDFISTTHILYNIQQLRKPIKFNFNAGEASMKKQGYLGS